MRKFWIIGVIVLVIVGGVALLLANLGRVVNNNKEFFLTKAEASIGRDVTVGEIGVTLRGGIGVNLKDVTISDDPDFSTQPFIEASDLQINAKLMPLLRKRFEVKRVVLRNPVIRVARNSQGIMNVDSFGSTQRAAVGRPVAELASGQEPSVPDASGTPADLSALVVSLVSIDNGELHYSDQSQKLDIVVAQIDSKVENVEFDKEISIHLEAAFLSEQKNLKLDGSFGPVGAVPNPRTLPLNASIVIDPVDWKPVAQTFALAEKLPPGFEANGPVSLRVDAAGKASELGGTLNIDATAMSIELPEQFTKAAGIPLNISSRLQAGESTVDLTGTRLLLHTLELNGSGTVHRTETPSIALALKSKPAQLKGWETILPALGAHDLDGKVSIDAKIRTVLAPGAKPDINGTLTLTEGTARLPELPKPITEIRSTVMFTGTSAEIPDATLRIGESRITASAKIEQMTPLAMTYQAASQTLTLDDIRPPNPKAKKPEVVKDASVLGRLTATPGEVPRNEGTITSKSGAIANVDYTDAKASFLLVGKHATFKDIKLAALDGELTGKGDMVLDDTKPEFNFETHARNVDLLKAFDALPVFARRHLKGKANLDLNIAGSGKDWDHIQPTVSGNGLAELFNGALIDINIFQNILSGISQSTGFGNIISERVIEKYPKIFKTGDTAFRDLKSSFVIEDGKLLARNMKLNAGDYAMSGVGALHFTEGLDMKVTLTISSALSADLIKDFNPAKYLTNSNGQIEVPFSLSGVLPKVSAKPDQKFVNDAIQKALLGKGTDLLKKDTGLKNLFDDLGSKLKKKKAPADTTSNN